jgi:hypothetical protein
MRRMSIGFFVTLLLVLSPYECYRTVSVKEVTAESIESLAPGEALIFGWMRMIDNGKGKECYISATEQLDMLLIRMEDEQALARRCVDQDGTFLWKVRIGTYLLTHLRWWEFRGLFPIRPQIAFQVGPDAEAYSLGKLRIEAEIERSALSVTIKRFTIAVADEYGQDVQLLTRQLPSFQGRVEKALMVHEARIPAVTEAEVKQSTFIGILRSLEFGLMTAY